MGNKLEQAMRSLNFFFNPKNQSWVHTPALRLGIGRHQGFTLPENEKSQFHKSTMTKHIVLQYHLPQHKSQPNNWLTKKEILHSWNDS